MANRGTYRTLLASLISAVVWSCVALALQSCGSLEGLRLFWTDQLFAGRHGLGMSPAPHPDVIIVGIDDRTIQQMRQQQPSGTDQRVIIRRTIAGLLNRLSKAGAKAAAVDFLLDVPLGQPADGEILDALTGRNGPRPVETVLASFLTLRETKRPFADLLGWADEGNVILQADPDGKFRRLRPEIVVTQGDGLEGGAVLVPLFSFQAARLQAGSRDNESGSSRATPWIWNQQTDGSLKAQGLPPVPAEMLVDFVGPAQTFEMLGRQFSADDVLDGKVGDESLSGKLVLIGPALRSADRFSVSVGAAGQQAYRRFLEKKYARQLGAATSLAEADLLSSGAMSGVEIHANAASQILQGRYLKLFDRRMPVLSGVLPFLLLPGLGWVFWRPGLAGRRRIALGLAVTSVWLAAGVAAMVAGSLAAFIAWRWVFIPLGLLAAWCGHAACGLSWQGVRHRRRSQRIERMFGSAVGEELLDYLNAHPEAMSTNIRRTATVLFCDIRGFTPLTERMDSDEVVRLLREHFEMLSQPLSANGAWVDKYVGDLVMAAWNVLGPTADHARLAVRSAIEMQAALRQANLQRQRQGLPIVQVGIGIHTGEVVAGNVGSRRRSNFTIIGETVNLASRIESTARPGEVLISRQTYEALAGEVAAQPLPATTLKGMTGQHVLYVVQDQA